MKVMVTGGTGFIGSYVVDRLVSEGHEVTILARNPNKVAGFLEHPRIKFVEGTLTTGDAIRASLRGKDACIHIALGWGDTAVEMAMADTVPSLRIFQTATEFGVKHLIYTSSIAAFGDSRQVYTDDTAVRPTGLYGATKAATESYLVAMAAESGVRSNVVRPGYTFGGPVVAGASIYTDRKLPNIVESAVRGEPISVTRNDGTQFIWAGDLARVYSSVLTSTVDREFFTAVSDDFMSWEEIARLAVAHTGSSSKIVVHDSDIDSAIGRNDVSAIERSFGLRFDSREHMVKHIAFLADRARV